MTDDQLIALWDDLRVRLIWRYGLCEGRKRYELLADDEEPDLLAWRKLGRPLDETLP